jgi:UDP-glucose 4-epimerase
MNINLHPIHEKPRSGDIRDSVSDISAAKKILGYKTRYSLYEGLEETIPWFRDKNHK